MTLPRRCRALLWLCCLLGAAPSSVAQGETHELTLDDHDFTVTRFAANGERLLIWVAAAFPNEERVLAMAADLAAQGIEVWHVDVLSNLFLTRNVSGLRTLDGRYVAALAAAAFAETGKQVTLAARSYAALPALKGARLWQQRAGDKISERLAGLILFSPELYRSIPPLGSVPDYDAIVDASNLPMMIFQAGDRGNGVQLDELVARLQRAGASVLSKRFADAIGVFYHEDESPAARAALVALRSDIPRVMDLLARLPKPAQPVALQASSPTANTGLDISLREYVGELAPLALDLPLMGQGRYRREDYRGQVTVVNFWATWCGPCVEEIPALNRLLESMRDEKFELVSVNYQEDADTMRAFMRQVDVDFPVLMDADGKVSQQWRALVFPSTYVIGPGGRFAYGVNGAIEWDADAVVDQLRELLPR